MSRRRGWRPAIAALGVSLGCRADAGQVLGGARLEVRWTGSDAAGFQAPATAEWCDSLNLLEIQAISGDTGLGIAIYPRDSVATGSYPVRPPAAADSVPPSSAIGLRWFSQTAVSGRFNAPAHGVSGKGAIRLIGWFDGLREHPATRGCSTAPPPPRPPARPDSEAGVD